MPLEGLLLGRYRLLHLLGTGGMGEVYLADDARVARQVAIKVIKSAEMPGSELESTPAQMAQRLFQREARAIASLQHPYILPLFDYGEVLVEENRLIYMVMPCCQDGSLESALRKQKSLRLDSLQQIAHILEQVADALQYAHEKQIVHQDVKLSNILIHRWRAPDVPDLLLADFGIAKFLSGHSSTSQSIRGTPTAMAPEQWEGHPVPATDQYALGIMAYQLLVGHPPFQGGPGQVMYQHLTVQPQPPSMLRPELPTQIDAIILRSLHKHPQERFATIHELAQEFRKALPTPGESEIPTLQSDPKESLSIMTARGPVTPIPPQSHEQILAQTIPAGTIKQNGASLETTISPSDGSISPLIQGFPPTIASNTPSVVLPETGNRGRLQSKRLAQQQRRGNVVQRLLLPLLILCLMAGSAGMALFLMHAFSSGTAGNTIIPSQTASLKNTVSGTTGNAIIPSQTASLKNTVTVANGGTTITPTTVPITGTTPQAITATSQTTGSNPYPPHAGSIALNDSLSDNSRGYNWEEGTRDEGACTFLDGAYQSAISLTGYFHSCLALSSNFDNFAYEVQMTLDSASAGGIVFRADRATTHLYYFTVDRNGGYLLKAYYDKIGDASVVASGSGISFNTTEIIGVVAQGNIFSLYINRQLITQVHSTLFAQGQVGVVTYEGSALFRNAQLWTL